MKVLVLTRSTGEGHNRAAHAVRAAFQAKGHDCVVMDAMSVALGRPRQPSAASDLAAKIYGWVALRAPFAFGAVYALGEVYTRTPIPSPIYFQNAKWAEATNEFIQANGFDAVVATHLFPQETLGVIRRRYPSRTKYFVVLTDYTCIPFFTEHPMDGFMIPHADLVRECVRRGVPKDRLRVTGMPVAPQFASAQTKDAARGGLGLPSDASVFLIMSGGVGSMRMGDLGDQLLTIGGESTRLIILPGRREDLFRQIAGRYQADPRVMVTPFTDRVADLMAASDVLLSKPGGASSTEAAVVGLPLVHTGTIPGNESKNARFFASHGMSLNAPKLEDAALAAFSLYRDPAAAAQMRAAQAANAIPDSAERVVGFVEEVSG